MNERFQAALKGEAQPTPPIWLMRQAGRYHRHYQKLRAQHSFMQLCKDPHLAAQVALGPIEDFDFDVAILFSDLLFPLEALGLGLEYTDQGPQLGRQLARETDLRPIHEAVRDLQFQHQALRETRKILPAGKSLIGFVGGPWTLFTYAVEGAHKGHLIAAKSQLDLFTQFCQPLVELLQANIALQLEGGAEVVMVFDTAAGELSPAIFNAVVQPQLMQMVREFPGRIAYYSKGTTHDHLRHLGSDWAGLGFDHRYDLSKILLRPHRGFCQGNFDQALLFSPDCRNEILRFLNPLRELKPSDRAGWVCGLGHGVLPQTPEAHVRLFVETVREVFS